MLLYFILGIVFIYIFIPIVDNLLGIISTWAQYTSFKFAAKCVKLKKQYGIEVEQQEEESENPIGFVYTEAVGVPQEPEIQIEEDNDEE